MNKKKIILLILLMSMSFVSATPNWDYNQSSQQMFYFFEDITINGIELTGDYVLGAFSNDISIGNMNWEGAYTTLPIMGDEGMSWTEGYLQIGEFPEIRIYDPITDLVSVLDLGEESQPFENLGLFTIPSISLYYNCEGYLINEVIECEEEIIIPEIDFNLTNVLEGNGTEEHPYIINGDSFNILMNVSLEDYVIDLSIFQEYNLSLIMLDASYENISEIELTNLTTNPYTDNITYQEGNFTYNKSILINLFLRDVGTFEILNSYYIYFKLIEIEEIEIILIYGCIDSNALNYNVNAIINEGCEYPPIYYGSTNYNSNNENNEDNEIEEIENITEEPEIIEVEKTEEIVKEIIEKDNPSKNKIIFIAVLLIIISIILGIWFIKR